MRFAPCFTLVTLLAVPLGAEPVLRLDKSQGESALRLIREGDTVRVYCKPCTDVAYSAVTVETRELRPFSGKYQLVVNGEPVDVASVHVDSGFGDGWENLADLLGFVGEAGAVAGDLPAAVDDVALLSPHAGSYAGTVGGAEARLTLELVGERQVVGSLVRGDVSYKVSATGYNAGRKGETLILVERDGNGRVTATLRGELDAAAGSFTGTRSPLDGSSQEPFRFTRSGG